MIYNYILAPSSSPVQDGSLSRIKHEFKSRWGHQIFYWNIIMNKPRLANGPRPDDRPFYIRSTCPRCTSCLILAYKILDPNAVEDDIFYDEWICPTCPDKVCYLDWPQDALDKEPSYKNMFGMKKDRFYN